MKLSLLYGHIKARPVFLIIAAIFIVSLISFSLLYTPTVNAQDKFIITVFDRGEVKSYATDADTVGEALNRAEVTISDGDIIEPGLDEEINSDSFNINIYRARTITVVDGDEERTIPTAFRSPEAIAQVAGFTVYPEDEYSFKRIDDFVAHTNVGLKLFIHRSTPVTFSLYGTPIKAHTQMHTVADFLSEQGIKLDTTDIIKPALSSDITPGMEIAVLRVGKNIITVEEDIPFDREIIQDTSLDFGTEKIKQLGVKGVAQVTYEVVYYDGVEVKRTEIQSVTIEKPKDEVVLRGTKAASVSGGNRELWLRAVGIPESDWGYVDYIISREAGWGGVTKWNYGGSGAYGICQALPGSKMASAGEDWATNGATQLRWCDGYARIRYGSWEGAYNFWITHNWW